MKTQGHLDFGLVYGSGNKIMAWHTDLENPILLATRKDSDEYGSHVTSLDFNDGILYDAGYGGIVRNTMTKRRVGPKQKNPQERQIFSLGFFNRELVALSHDERDQKVHLFYVKSNEEIGIFGMDQKEELCYRPHSLDMVIDEKNRIYVSSENVIEVISGRNNQKPTIKKLTSYMSDFVQLACDGEKTYALSTHNPDTNPRGTTIQKMPSQKIVTFWKPDKDWENLPRHQRSYGYAHMFAAAQDALIIGTENHDTKENNIYLVPLTSKMRQSKTGFEGVPQLLIKNAFKESQVYGKGNPLLVLPRKILVELLSS